MLAAGCVAAVAVAGTHLVGDPGGSARTRVAAATCVDGAGTSGIGVMTALAAGLVDAYARLKAEGAGEIIVLYAESAAPPVYADQEEEPGTPGVFLALKLRLGAGEVALSPGRTGAAALIRALAAGATGVRFELPRVSARAA